MHVIVRLISSDQDEPENPEDLPEYKQKMRGDRVMGINYSFLWQHLEPSQLLPKLVDKELMTEIGKQIAESYKQKFAQNAVIINELFGSHCSPLKLCDTLDVTRQEHIARKLLQGTHCVGYGTSTVSSCYVMGLCSVLELEDNNPCNLSVS